MEPNVTYLFGAGASHEAVPLVKEIPEEIKRYIDVIEKEDKESELLETLKWLKNGALEFGAVDDFANSVYNNDFSNFKKLKAAMCCFFTYV